MRRRPPSADTPDPADPSQPRTGSPTPGGSPISPAHKSRWCRRRKQGEHTVQQAGPPGAAVPFPPLYPPYPGYSPPSFPYSGYPGYPPAPYPSGYPSQPLAYPTTAASAQTFAEPSSDGPPAQAPTPAIAGILGPTAIAQLVIGNPSPATPPAVAADTYRSFPFHPDTAIDGWSTPTATVRGTSLRGHMHRAYGIPRQDDFAVHHLPNGTLIVTVADGVSQAPQSHIGAQTATRYAANWLQLNLTETVDDTDWTNLLQSTAWALNKHAQKLFGLADPDPFRTEQELATTLVCGVVEPLDTGGLRAHLINCGDSSTWTLSGGCFTEILGGKAPDSSGIASSEVAGLPRVPRQIRPTVIDIAPGDVLLIGTDGIGEPLGNGEGAVGTLLRDLLLRPTAPSLIEFAHTIDFSRETFDDDRTLVAVWPNTPPP